MGSRLTETFVSCLAIVDCKRNRLEEGCNGKPCKLAASQKVMCWPNSAKRRSKWSFVSEQDNNRGEACIMSAGGSLRDRVLRRSKIVLCCIQDYAVTLTEQGFTDSRLQLGFVPGDGIKRDPDMD